MLASIGVAARIMLRNVGGRNVIRRNSLRVAIILFWLVAIPLALASYFLKIWEYDVNIPFYYDKTDSIWQFTLTKLLLDTGWILRNPFMGAPSVADWYNNPAAQSSAMHSILMWFVGLLSRNPVSTQQCYYILNFPFITVTSYIACRLLNIERFLAISIGLLFAFLPARFNLIAYAFLSNYFIIPLALVPAIWVITGRFANQAISTAAARGVLRALPSIAVSRLFLVSLSIVVATALTDGYYAFFAVLLLGVATMLRMVIGDIKWPLSFVAPLALILALMATALLLTAPLRVYQHNHPGEFAPNGIADPVYQRQPFEAVVYSSSLMTMLAPSDRHRLPSLARLGQYIVGTSNQARVYPTNQWSPLGTLGSFLFLTMLVSFSVLLISGSPFSVRLGFNMPLETRRLLGAISVLSMFVLGCSIFGGFGALIALIYPTIRAYDRFPVFLSFLLLCGAGVFLTAVLDRSSRWSRRVICVVLAAVTVCGLFDQVPYDPLHQGTANAYAFRADRRFVSVIETALPDRAMVYQYPYSNYLTANRYYGWGSFADMRFYLHSHHLRWSSGASKNSPVDLWHQRLAQLSMDQRLTELEAVGFRGFLVDRTVVPDEEYSSIRRLLVTRTGREPTEDVASQLAFWTLPDPGYNLVYGPDFSDPIRMVISDQRKLENAYLPRLVRRTTLAAMLANTHADAPLVIERSDHPEVFRNAAITDRGLGLEPITTAPLVAGDVSCAANTGAPLSVTHDQIVLLVHNRSSFDWTLNSGAPFPLRVGMMELLNGDGLRLRWDGGFRVPGTIRIAAGESAELHVSLAGVDIHTGVPNSENHVTAVFALLQEGSEWFNGASGDGVCRVQLTQ